MWSAAGWWDLSYPTDGRSAYIPLSSHTKPQSIHASGRPDPAHPHPTPATLQWVMFNLNLSALGKMNPK